MAEKRKGTTARAAAKKVGNRKKAPSQVAPQIAAAPRNEGQQGAAKKASARKNAAPRVAAKKPGLKKPTSPEERHLLIQEVAYFKAEQQGFNCDPSECWLIAEAEVDA